MADLSFNHICVLLLGLFSCCVVGVKKCEDGWFDIGDRCYTVIPMPQNFIGAIALCKTTSFGGSMLELETVSEKAALVRHLSTTYEVIFPAQKFWVGAKGGRSVFLWNNGQPVSYVDYVDGIGNGVGCLCFGTPTLQKYLVTNCLEQNIVICEKTGTTTPVG